MASGAVNFGARLDPRKGVAEGTKTIDKSFGGVGHRFSAVGLAGFHRHQGFEVFFLAQVFTFQLHRGHGERLAFFDGDGQGDVLLVWRDRHLRRFDIEFQIAAVQVVGAQRFQIGIQLGPRVAIGLGVEVQPAAVVQIKQILQRAFGKRAVADDAYFADAGDRTFGHGEGHVHTVALLRRDGGHHFRAVQTAGQVLTFQLLFGTVGQSFVKGLAFANAEVFQRLGQRFLVEFFQAHKVDAGDDRAFFDDHHHHAVFDFNAHVFEQTGSEQSAQCGRAFVVAVRVANSKRQGCENGSGIGALQTFNAYVFELERLDRQGRGRVKRGSDGESQGGGTVSG